MLVLLAGAGFALLAVLTLREGPDRTVTGTISQLELHRVCVADGTGRVVCVGADSPQTLVGFTVGDCVRLGYTPEGKATSLHRAANGCEQPN